MSALNGLRVIELSRVLAGPYCAQILGDLGAEVIKVEPPDGDETRHWGPPFFEDQSAYFLSANRNKKCLRLNLADKKDLARLHQLLQIADVVIDNFKPGTLEKFGLNFAVVQKLNPRLIWASITAFGETSPRKEEPGYDALIQGLGGMMSITGFERPTKIGVALTDVLTALYTCIGILAALQERVKSGLGQRVELALMDVQVASLVNVAMNYLVSGKVPERLGNHHPTIVPYGMFKCADREVMLAVGNDGQFGKLCHALNVEWMKDSRFATNPARVENRQVLEPMINEKLSEKPAAFWIDKLKAAKVPCDLIQDLNDLSRDPHILAEDIFTKMSDGKTPCIRNPLKFSRSKITAYKVPTQS